MGKAARKSSILLMIFLMTVLQINFVFAEETQITLSDEELISWKVNLTSVSSQSYNSIKVSWNKVEEADRYEVFRKDSKKGSFKMKNGLKKPIRRVTFMKIYT